MSVFWRRRLTGLLGVLIVLAGLGGALAWALGGGRTGDPRVPGGGGGGGGAAVVDAVAAPGPPTGLRYPRPPAFRPDPAAARLAETLPLPVAVAQVFVLTSPPSGEAPALRGFGGMIVTRAAAAAGGGVAGVVSAALRAARSAGSPAPLTGVSEGNPSGSNPPAVEAAARRQAGALRALGVNLVLAPAADVDVPGGAISGGLFSSDPATVARLAAAAVAGFTAGGVVAAVGHFPGEGSASADPDQQSASVGGSLGTLEARDVVPFRYLAAAAPVIVLSNAAYTAFDGVTPASLLPAAVRLLRGLARYPGVVMSGDLDATLQPTGLDPGAVALAGLRAGDDLLYISGTVGEQQAAYGAVLTAAEGSATVRALVRTALVRDLTLKARFGLLGSA